MQLAYNHEKLFYLDKMKYFQLYMRRFPDQLK